MFYLSYAMVVIASDKNVVNMHNQIDTPLSWMAIENRVVSLTPCYTELLDHDSKSSKLSPSRLFKAI